MGSVRRLGHLVGVEQPARDRQLDVLLARDLFEQAADLVVLGVECGKQLAELGLVGRRHGADRIEARQHETLLVWCQVDVAHRQLSALALLQGQGRPQVAVD